MRYSFLVAAILYGLIAPDISYAQENRQIFQSLRSPNSGLNQSSSSENTNQGDPRVVISTRGTRQKAMLLGQPSELRIFRQPGDRYFLSRSDEAFVPPAIGDALLIERTRGGIIDRYSYSFDGYVMFAAKD